MHLCSFEIKSGQVQLSGVCFLNVFLKYNLYISIMFVRKNCLAAKHTYSMKYNVHFVLLLADDIYIIQCCKCLNSVNKGNLHVIYHAVNISRVIVICYILC